MKRYLNVIGGQCVEPSTGEWLDCIDPARGSVFAQVPKSGVEDARVAIESAGRAFADGPWPRLSGSQRARLLRRLAELLEKHFEELLELETRDVGRAARDTRFGLLPMTIEAIYYYAGLADKTEGETIRLGPDSFNYTLVEPLGVVGLIIPYNAPLVILAGKLGAALAAGNTVVAKPSEHAASACLRFGEICLEAGLPEGVVNVVSGLGADVGNEIVVHPLVKKIGFTGSIAAAQRMAAAGAPRLKQFQFELGGKSPHLIFEDADITAAAPMIVRGVMTGSAGQTCIAGSRILVHRPVWDEVVEAVREEASKLKLGDPASLETDVGPLSFERQFQVVEQFVAEARSAGDRLLLGGSDARSRFPEESPFRGGYFYEPTFFLYDDQSSKVCRDEIFGPVGALVPFDTEEDAIRMSNDTDLGLGAGIWTADLKRALRFAAAVESGNVWVNTYRRQHWALPFGGYKMSGFGKDFGQEAVREFQQKKSVWMQIEG